MIDYLKPIGAFLEYTVRPLIDEFKWFLKELDKRGINVNENNIKSVLNSLMRGYVVYALINLVQAVTVTVLVCLTALMILKG